MGYWLGCYTADAGGEGIGITPAVAGPGGGLRLAGPVTELASPSFLGTHPHLPVIYAVSETTASVYALRHAGGALRVIGAPAPTGSKPCHVAVAPDGCSMVVACWGDGAVLSFGLSPEGEIAGRYVAEAAVDPYRADRQSRAHAALFLDDGRVMTTDIDFDLVRVWEQRPGDALGSSYSVALPEGCGPRHLLQALDGTVYIVTEYSIEVIVLRRTPASSPGGRFGVVGVFPATADGVQPGDKGAGLAAWQGDGGRWLYAGVRGSDRICVLALDGAGSPQAVADVPCGGRWPRDHLVHDGQLHVALQRSHEVASFGLDGRSGLPVGPAHRMGTGSPSVIIAAPGLG